MRTRTTIVMLLLTMCCVLVAVCTTEAFREEASSNVQTVASTDGDAAAPQVTTAWSPPTLEFVVDEIQDLEFADFLDTAYRLLLMRSPQTVTDLGFADMLGMRNDRLNDYSETYVLETQRIESAILDQLRTYDRDALSEDDRLTYDVAEWYFDDLVRGHAFFLYSYPVNQFFITSLDQQLVDLMTEVHPFRNADDVADYMVRLEHVDDQLVQIMNAIERREDGGIVVPRVMIDWALQGISALVTGRARRHPFFTTLDEKSLGVGLPGEERERILKEAETIVSEQVQPAYEALFSTMQSLRAVAPTEIGFGQCEGGADYYEYALRHQNQTTLTPQEIHDLGLQEVARLKEEIEQAASGLGMPDGLSLSEIYRRATTQGGSLSGGAIVTEYERLLDEAKSNAGEVFERLPAADVIVVPDPIGGYYRPAPADGSRLAQFAASNQGSTAKYRMATLTYHETIPGHHLQIALAQELGLPLLRSAETFLGYTEGWALYAEELAWELGWYDDNPYGNIGRLSDQMMRAVRLVVDTGIHVLGWSFDRAVAYFAEYTGRSYGESQYNILRYAAWPGQSTAYMVGRLEVLRLRAHAQETLGDAFDLVGFHTAVLENGSVPLEILGRIVDDYIDRTLEAQEG